MRRLPLVTLIFLLLASAVKAQSYTETFTTTTFKDAAATTAIWDTQTGSIHLPQVGIDVQGGIFMSSANRVLRMGSTVVVARQGAGVDLVDVSNPASPQTVGHISYGGGFLDPVVEDIARTGSVLYVSWSDVVTIFPQVIHYGVDVYSLADPAAPVYVYTVSLRADVLCVHGNRLYAVDGSGLSIWDITDAAFPASLGTIALGGTTTTVDVSGSIAFVGTNTSGVQVVDVKNATAPSLLTTFSPGGAMSHVTIDGFLLCASAGSVGLHLVDVTDPSAPSLLSTFTTGGSVQRASVDGDVVVLGDDSGRITLLDVTVPTAPVEVASRMTAQPVRDIELAGMQIYMVNDDGFGVYRGALGYPPQRVRTTSVGTLPVTRIIADGDRVYFADGAVHIYDNRRTTPFTELGSWGGTGVNSFDVDGRFLYAVDPAGIFHVLDVSNPAAITDIGTVDTSRGSMADVVADGQMVWLLYAGTPSPGVYAVDVSQPAAPVMAGYYQVLGGVKDLEIAGSKAYVIAGSGGVSILSIADPSNITLQGNYSMGSIFDGALAAQGKLLYVVGGAGLNDEFEVVDVGIPSAPVKLGGTNPIPPGIAYLGQLSVQGGRAFFTEGQMLHIIDVSDPTAPVQVHEYDPPVFHNSDAVGISGNFAYFALRFDPFNNPDSRIEEVRILDRGVLSSANVAQSLSFATVPYDVVALRLTPTAVGTIDWTFSGDGGLHFYPRQADGSWETGLGQPQLGGLRWQATLRIEPGQPLPECTDLAVDWRYAVPLITSLTDVPDDQGGWLELTFLSSGYELLYQVSHIASYAVYRMGYTGWDSVATVAGNGVDTHTVVVPTEVDSTLWGGAIYTRFFVRAWDVNGWDHYDAPEVMAYSIDNLAPASPGGVSVDYHMTTSNRVQWNAVTDPDLRLYRIHRGTTPNFPLTGLTRADSVPKGQLFWDDPYNFGWEGTYYAVTAVDSAGNESAPTYPSTVTSAGEGTPSRHWALGQNVPNPFNPSTVISFTAPEAGGRVTLAVYDVSGRRVATLLDRRVRGGFHDVRWNGVDDAGRRVSSGIYFYHLKTPAGTFTRKMILVE